MKAARHGDRIAVLRKHARISLRELGRKAGLAPASLSAIERGISSPTLGTLHKILRALGTDFAGFFAGTGGPGVSPVFKASDGRIATDARQSCTLLFPKRGDLKFEIMRERIRPTAQPSEWETFDFDVGGLMLSGSVFVIEIEQRGEWPMGVGDAFYIPAGTKHRSTNRGQEPVEIVTVCSPPRY